MQKLLFIILINLGAIGIQAQDKFLTRSGSVEFFSTTPVEDIKATNNQVSSILKTSTQEIVFNVLMRSFSFKKALMEEHFNEKYVESEIYPSAKFKGKIVDEIDFSQDGEYENVEVKGTMIFHGVEKEITVNGNIIVDTEKENISCSSKFIINPEDYKIEIPSLVRDKISNSIEITTQFVYTKS